MYLTTNTTTWTKSDWKLTRLWLRYSLLVWLGIKSGNCVKLAETQFTKEIGFSSRKPLTPQVQDAGQSSTVLLSNKIKQLNIVSLSKVCGLYSDIWNMKKFAVHPYTWCICSDWLSWIDGRRWDKRCPRHEKSAFTKSDLFKKIYSPYISPLDYLQNQKSINSSLMCTMMICPLLIFFLTQHSP